MTRFLCSGGDIGGMILACHRGRAQSVDYAVCCGTVDVILPGE